MIYRFGQCELDSDRLELRRDGELQSVEPQVFSLLVHLIENRERVVTKDDLIAAVWGGRIVSEATLSSRINAARRAVGDSGKDQAVIKTNPRRGFRFVAQIENSGGRASRESSDTRAMATAADEPISDLALPNRPSIAVLPFENMSDDLEQQYFADGLADDIITILSKLSDMFVIARNSSFAYKDRPTDIRKIADELGVRAVLVGSVRRSGERIRITGQLVDAKTGNHLWAERYDRQLADIFDLQDEITREIVTSLRVKLTEGDQVQLRRRQTNNVEAWETYCRGQSYLRRFNKVDNDQARLALDHVVTIDPDFSSAWSHLAWVHYMDARGGWRPVESAFEQMHACAEKSRALDDRQPDAYAMLGCLALHRREHDDAIALGRKAIELGPSIADNFALLGMILSYSGHADEGLELIEKAIRLSPHFPDWYLGMAGIAYDQLERYDDAIAVAKARLARNPDNIFSDFRLAAIYQKLARYHDAGRHAVQALRKNPSLCLSQIRVSEPYKDQAALDAYLDLLRNAGLPE